MLITILELQRLPELIHDRHDYEYTISLMDDDGKIALNVPTTRGAFEAAYTAVAQTMVSADSDELLVRLKPMDMHEAATIAAVRMPLSFTTLLKRDPKAAVEALTYRVASAPTATHDDLPLAMDCLATGFGDYLFYSRDATVPEGVTVRRIAGWLVVSTAELLDVCKARGEVSVPSPHGWGTAKTSVADLELRYANFCKERDNAVK